MTYAIPSVHARCRRRSTAVLEALAPLPAGDVLLALRSLAVLMGTRRASAVLAARAEGMSWQDIADRLGMSRQSVWDRYGAEDLDPPRPARGRRSRARVSYGHTVSNCAAYKAHQPPTIGTRPVINAVNDTDFNAAVTRSDLPVLVEFGASWCPPCRMIAPVLADVAAERASRLRVVTMDVDANPATQTRYGVLSLPTLLLFVGGKPVRQ